MCTSSRTASERLPRKHKHFRHGKPQCRERASLCKSMSQILVLSWKTFGSCPGRRAHLPRKRLEDVNPSKKIRRFQVLLLVNVFHESTSIWDMLLHRLALSRYWGFPCRKCLCFRGRRSEAVLDVHQSCIPSSGGRALGLLSCRFE